MATLQTLYAQNPMWIWLAVAAFCMALNVATGWARLVWPMLAAVVVAALLGAHVKLASPLDVVAFAVLAIAGLAASYLVKPLAPRPAPEANAGEEQG